MLLYALPLSSPKHSISSSSLLAPHRPEIIVVIICIVGRSLLNPPAAFLSISLRFPAQMFEPKTASDAYLTLTPRASRLLSFRPKYLIVDFETDWAPTGIWLVAPSFRSNHFDYICHSFNRTPPPTPVRSDAIPAPSHCQVNPTQSPQRSSIRIRRASRVCSCTLLDK